MFRCANVREREREREIMKHKVRGKKIYIPLCPMGGVYIVQEVTVTNKE